MTVLAPGSYLIELEFTRRIDYATLTSVLEQLGFVQITPDDTMVETAIGAINKYSLGTGTVKRAPAPRPATSPSSGPRPNPVSSSSASTPAFNRQQGLNIYTRVSSTPNNQDLSGLKAKIAAALKAKQEAEARAKAAGNTKSNPSLNPVSTRATGAFTKAQARVVAMRESNNKPMPTRAELEAYKRKKEEEARARARAVIEKARQNNPTGEGKRFGRQPPVKSPVKKDKKNYNLSDGLGASAEDLYGNAGGAQGVQEQQLKDDLAQLERDRKVAEDKAGEAYKNGEDPLVAARDAIDPNVYAETPLLADAMAEKAASKYTDQNFQGWKDPASDGGGGGGGGGGYGGYGGGSTDDPFAAQDGGETGETGETGDYDPSKDMRLKNDAETQALVVDMWRKWKEWGSPFAEGPAIAGEEDVPYRVRFIAKLRNPLRLFDKPGMKWLYVRRLGLNPFSDLDFRLQSHPLRRGGMYELRFLSRAKSMPSREAVKQGLVSMGFAPMKLSVMKKNMRIPGRAGASLTLWYAIAAWEKGDSTVTMSDPFFFLNCKEITK